MSQEPTYTFKFLLLGDAAVGKTALVNRFVHGKFQKDYLMTLGMEPYSRYETVDEIPILYSIWDIAGQKKFEAMRSMFYRGAKAALLTFDLTRLQSFESLQEWVDGARKFAPKIMFILVGNKNDLVDLRIVKREDAEQKAKELGAISYIETSALSGENVGEAFYQTASSLITYIQERMKQQ